MIHDAWLCSLARVLVGVLNVGMNMCSKEFSSSGSRTMFEVYKLKYLDYFLMVYYQERM